MVNKRFDVMADRGGEDKTALCRLILGGINGRGIRWGVKKIRESGSKGSGEGFHTLFRKKGADVLAHVGRTGAIRRAEETDATVFFKVRVPCKGKIRVVTIGVGKDGFEFSGEGRRGATAGSIINMHVDI